MEPRGVKKIFQDEHMRYIVVCNDGTMWITVSLDGLGRANWKCIDPIPNEDYEGTM